MHRYLSLPGRCIQALRKEEILTFLVPTFFFSFCFAYCLFHYLMGGLRAEHLALSFLVFLFYLIHPKLRVFSVLGIPFTLQGMAYDSLRYVPFRWLYPIHIEDLYRFEKSLFGLSTKTGILSPNEYLAQFSNSIFYLITGICYHTMIPAAILMMLLVWILNSRVAAQRYGFAFLGMNLVSYLTFLLYPAAAPWYVAKYGFKQPLYAMHGDPAGLVHFDQMLGADLSTEIYRRNPFVFGAMPSTHAAITMLAWLYSYKLGKKWFLGFGIYAIWMFFGALFLQHHYLVDVLFGIFYAITAYLVVEKILKHPFDKLAKLFLKIFQKGPKTFLK